MDNVRLAVSASVSMDNSDINRIQSELEQLSKQLRPIKVGVEIADNIEADLVKSLKSLERETSRIGQNIKMDSPLSSREIEREASKIVSTVDTISGATSQMNVHIKEDNQEIIDSYRRVGEELTLVSRRITEDIERINSQNKELKLLDIPKAESSLKHLVSQYGDYINTDEIKKAKSMLDDIASLSYDDAMLQLRVFNQELQNMRRAAAEAKREFARETKLELVDIPKAEANLNRLKQAFGDIIDETEVRRLEDMLSGIANLSYDESRLQLQQVNSEVTELRRNARELQKEMQDAIKLETVDIPKIDNAFQNLVSDFGEHLRVTELAEVYDLLDGIKDIPYDDARLRIQQINTAIGELREEGAQLAKEAQSFMQLEEIDKPKMIGYVDELIERFGELGKHGGLQDLKREISELSSTDKDLAIQKDILNQKIRETEQNYMQLADAIGHTTSISGIFKSSIMDVASALGVFALGRKAVQSFVGSIKNGAQHVQEMDSKLVEISMVTGQSREEVAGLTEEFNLLANELSVRSSQVAEGAVEFYRQGLSTEEVMERLRYTTMYAKQANVDFGESAELITAIVNGMGVETSTATDVMIALGNATATSAEEIGRGVARVSGTAGAMGVEFEKVSSWIGAVSAKTRENAESIGSSINMILSRMNQISKKGYFEDDGTSINDVEQALSAAGVKLREMQDGVLEFRKSSDVLDDLAERWDSLDQTTQQYVGTTLAGARQLSRFYNLMDGYQDSLELYEIAMNSAGDTSSNYEHYLDGAEAATERFKQALEELYQTIWDSDSLASLIDMLTELIEVITKLVDKFGIVGTGGMVFGGIMLGKMVAGMADASSKMALFKAAGFEAAEAMSLLAQGSSGLAGVGTAASVAGVGLGELAGTIVVSLGKVGLALAAIIGIAMAGKAIYDHFDDSVDYDTAMSNAEEVAQISELRQEYIELSGIQDINAEQKQRLKEVTAELTDLMPELISDVDEEGEVILKNTELTREMIDTKRELAEIELRDANTDISKDIARTNDQIEIAREWVKRLNDELQEHIARRDEINSQGDLSFFDKLELGRVEEDIERTTNAIQRHKENILELGGDLSELEAKQLNVGETLSQLALDRQFEIGREIALRAENAGSIDELIHLKHQLIDAGYTEVEAKMILQGEIDNVIIAYEHLDDWKQIDLENIENLSAAEVAHAKTLIHNSVVATDVAIKNTYARIRAIKAEIAAMQARDGAFRKTSAGNITWKDDDGFDLEAYTVKNQRLRKEQQKIDDFKADLIDMSEIEGLLNEVGGLAPYSRSDTGLKGSSPSGRRGSSGGGKKGRSSGGSSSASARAEAKAEADRYESINALIEMNNNLLEHNKNIQDRIRHNNPKKLKHMKDEMNMLTRAQQLQNQLNNMRRTERAELEKELASQGFVFSGEGDQRMIQNMSHIEGKSKELEESFKRFIEIQTKEIPSASKEWFNLQKQIDELKIERLTVKFEDAIRVVDGFRYAVESLSKEMEFMADDDFVGRAEIMSAQYDLLKESVKETEFALDNLVNHGFKKGSVEYDIYEEKIKEAIERLGELELQLHQTAKGFDEMREAHRKNFIEEQNRLYSEQQDRLSALNDLQSKLVSIIKERQKVETDAMKKRHKEEMDRLKERHDKVLDNMKEELDEYNKMIDEKIARLKDQHAEEDYEEALAEERAKLAEIEAEVNRLSLDDSLEGRSRYHEALKKLEEQQTKIAKMERDKARKDEIKYLENKKKDRDKDVKDFEDKEKDKYETEKDRLEKIQEEELKSLEERYSNYNIYSEARKAIINGEIEYIDGRVLDLQTAIDLFERNFGEKMGIMGDSIERDFIQQWEKAIEALERYEYKLENLLPYYDPDDKTIDDGWNQQLGGSDDGRRPREFAKWSDADYDEYLENKKLWSEATTQAERDRYERRNKILRDRYQMDEDKWSYDELTSMQEGRPREFRDWRPEDYKEYMENKRLWNAANTQADRELYARRNQLLRQKYGMSQDSWDYDDLLALSDKRGRRPREFFSWDDDDYRRYVDNKRSFEMTDNPTRKKRLSAENEELRRKYWNHNKDVYDWRELMAGYDTGGFIPRDGVIMAHEKEMVVPFEYQEKLWSAIQMLGVKGLDAVDTSQQINKGDTIFYDVDVKVDGRGVASTELDARIRRQIEMKERDRNISLMKRGVKA